MSDASPAEALAVFYRDYIDRFNTRDARAMAPLFDYPAVMTMATGVVSLADADACAVFYAGVLDYMREHGWDKSAVDGLQTFVHADDSALILADYSRHRRDGSLLERGRSAYVMRKRDGIWRVTAIIDKLGDHPADAAAK